MLGEHHARQATRVDGRIAWREDASSSVQLRRGGEWA
jgi:hypothetical protein